MASLQEVLELCRLCLIKDDVNTPIFEDEDDISHVFLKLSACLPIKVSRDDLLPKRICESCFYKLELFYEFLKTCTTSEKQLLSWINPLKISTIPLSKSGSTILLKQEVPELIETDDLNIPSETQDYELQQPYEGVEFEFQQEEFIENESGTNVNEASGEKRKRGVTLETLQDDLDSDDDIRVHSSKHAKTEDDIDSDNDAEETFDEIPSTSGDNDQPGPSGVGKAGTDPPAGFITYGQLAVFMKDERIDIEYSNSPEKENFDENSMDSFSFPEDEEETFDNLEIFYSTEEEGLKEILEQNQLHKPKSVPKKYSLCSICGKHVTMLDKHNKLYHGTFKCQICVTPFRTQDELEAHNELHGNNEFPCDQCTLSFKKPIDYSYHSKEHCSLKTYSCPLCQFKTSSRGSIKIHIQHHEKNYKYHCDMCDRGFISNSVYSEHIEGHAGIKKFQCDICLKKFLYKRYLMVHRKLNHKKILEGYEDVNECHICKRKFSFEKSLVRHLSKIHGIGKDVSVDCTVCNKRIANPYNLKMHMRTHTGEKPYVCETCGKAFTKRVNLKRHLINLHD